MYYNKSLVKASEKAFINLRRDLFEIEHLHNSRNIRTFLNNSQERFEKNIYFELQNLGLNSSLIINKHGEKELPIKTNGKLDLIILGLDNLAIFSHGLGAISFALAILEGDEIISASLAMPFLNAIMFNKADEVFILDNEGVSKKVKMINATNIVLPTLLVGVDQDHFILDNFLPKRDIIPLSSSSLLYEISLLMQNKLDLVAYKKPHNDKEVKILEYLVNKAGGDSYIIGDSIFFGKKSLIKTLEVHQNKMINPEN
jgi:hypothetical protein